MKLSRLLRLFVAILPVLLPLQTLKPQEITKLRSTLSTGGSSGIVTVNNRQYYLQHSIGQSGVTGLSQNIDYQLRQGFIQPLEESVKKIDRITLPSTIYPNPFYERIKISFKEEISDILNITLTDFRGKILFVRKYGATQELNLDLGSLASGLYIIRVNAASKCFNSVIIKL